MPDETTARAPGKSHTRIGRPPFECIALLLQGGGALGAYQAGVYEALSEAHLEPDWIAGISVGAINAALIAGNPPGSRIEKLREFWQRVTCGGPWDAGALIAMAPAAVRGDFARSLVNQLSAGAALVGGVPGFFAPRFPVAWLQPPGSPEATSYYDTAPLMSTLERLADFDRINAGHMRFSVGAVNVSSGNFVYFDSTTHTIGPEHVTASGALPPGFPPVEIEGEFYWDGGLVSNTPLQWVLESQPRRDTLAFQVDLWSARGTLPQKLPEELRDSPEVTLLQPHASPKVYNLVQLVYRAKQYEGDSKDYEFSRLSMEDHWQAGYYDTVRTLRHPEVLARPDNIEGVMTFDLSQNGRE